MPSSFSKALGMKIKRKIIEDYLRLFESPNRTNLSPKRKELLESFIFNVFMTKKTTLHNKQIYLALKLDQKQ